MDEEFLNDSINDLLGGAAVLFVGAGFSLGATDARDRPVPDVPQLCREIYDLAKMEYDSSVSLSSISEYCINELKLNSEIQQLLINRLTLCKPKDYHYDILRFPWRSVFTTNFDDVAEVALAEKKPQIVTPVFNVKHLESGRTPLYYLHGRALDILRGQSDSSIIISESNTNLRRV